MNTPPINHHQLTYADFHPVAPAIIAPNHNASTPPNTTGTIQSLARRLISDFDAPSSTSPPNVVTPTQT